MDYISLQVHCGEEAREMILAELSLLTFDAFEENDKGLLASCAIADWQEEEVRAVIAKYGATFEFHETEKVNWNEEWEKHYDPVIVGDQCIVRAAFHAPRPEFPYEIIITPKMSFGTGHHATTYQMLSRQLLLDHTGKRVLDVGSGTGALAIMAWKRGAAEVTAVDIDEWCIENGHENFALNGCEQTDLRLGGIEVISPSDNYDIILANINKNVLMAQMEDYAIRLKSGGILLLSGFYQADIQDLLIIASSFDLHHLDQTERNQWAMLALTKGS